MTVDELISDELSRYEPPEEASEPIEVDVTATNPKILPGPALSPAAEELSRQVEQQQA